MPMVTLRENKGLCGSFIVSEQTAPFYWPCEHCKKCGVKIHDQGSYGGFPMSWWCTFSDCEHCQGRGFIRRKERNPDYVEPVEQKLAASP